MVEPGPAEPGSAAQKSSWSLAASRPARWIRESRSLPSLPTAAPPPPPVDSPKRRLADFAARHGLGDEAVAELQDQGLSQAEARDVVLQLRQEAGVTAELANTLLGLPPHEAVELLMQTPGIQEGGMTAD